MKRANSVPSIPGGQSCPDRIRNGIILPNRSILVRTQKLANGLRSNAIELLSSQLKESILELVDCISQSRTPQHHVLIGNSILNV
jgi:hypothetical protein